MCRRSCGKAKLVLPAAQLATGDTDFDPAEEMRRLAGRLAGAYAQDPSNAPLARELRATLLALPPDPDGPDPLEEIRARYIERREAERY